MTRAIWLDMDGTIADLYGVDGWLICLRRGDISPYVKAKSMHNMSQLARLLKRAQRKGYTIGIISWTSKSGTQAYNKAVAQAKHAWLEQHLHSVHFDVIHVVEYGTDKYSVCGGGILFDDEEQNRKAWKDVAFPPDHLIDFLKKI